MTDEAKARPMTTDETVEAIVAWLRAEALLCDCFAREEAECVCGAWYDDKQANIAGLATAIEQRAFERAGGEG